jgi:hypothetical protein
MFRGFRPASLPTATTRDRGRLSLIAAIRQEVLGVSGDPDVRQQRLRFYLVRGQGHQRPTYIRERFDSMALGPGQDAETDRRGLTAPVVPDK